ncbi:MAG: aminopeptidase [Acholeplasmataceae bacterium]
MPNQVLITKLAELAVKVGVNVNKGQIVVVRTSTDTVEIAREVAKQAYLAGAKQVFMEWGDEFVSRDFLLYASDDTITEILPFTIDKYHYYVDQNACFISVSSPIPGLQKDVDPSKAQKLMIASSKAIHFWREHMMGNKSQWTIIAAPNPIWAKQVFPHLSEEDAVEKLWEAIFDASRVYENSDPIAEWKKHNEMLLAHNKILNNYNFKHLHFKNSLGTDLIVELVKDHIWAGGGEHAGNGTYFNPNIPTEESFTMPYKFGTQGKVFATKPLNYQGKLIDGFWLEFKDGKVVDFGADKEEATLKSLLDTDEGSRYIGEIALISHDSPISNTNILFLNTLFDENASCHMALGRAYPMNIKGGIEATIPELEKKGYNNSMNHVDFMFGNKDMEIIGVRYDGSKVKVFENGNFVV